MNRGIHMFKIRSWVAAGAVALFLFGATACNDNPPGPAPSVTTSAPDDFDTDTFDPETVDPEDLDTDTPLPDDFGTDTALPDDFDTDTALPDTGTDTPVPDYEHDCGISGKPECNITLPPPDIGPWE